MVHISAKLAVVALAAAPALASAIAYDASEYDARDYDDMTDIEARKIPIGGIKVAAKFAGKWFNRLSTGATVLSLGGAVAGAASQPRSFDDFEEFEARGNGNKNKNKKGRKSTEARKARKAKKAAKRRARKAKKTPASDQTTGAEGGAGPVDPNEGGAGPVEGRMVKRRLSARDFLLDEELQELEAREEFFSDLNLD